MADTSYITFFGDAEYQFKLTPELICELEAKTNSGIGAIASRIFARTFAQSEITETIRLALIGGGTAPKRAAELIAAYAADRPLSETHPIAAKIMERVWVGSPDETSK
jgi:hypothetical protein